MKLITKSIIAGLVLVSGSAFAAQPVLQQESKLAQILNLTPDQQQQIHIIHDQAQLQMDNIKHDESGRDVILNNIKSDHWDADAVKKRIATLSVGEQQARYISYKYYYDVMQKLTPDQKVKLSQIIK
jgi:Spy/CpxP family protein refolding chaperone